MTDKELIRALRRTQSRSKRALLDEAAERILDYAVELNNTEYDMVCNYLDRVPTADVAPVVHGRWIMHPDDIFPAESTQECSICHEHEFFTLCNENYCPNCGAKMDGGVNE